MKKQIQREELVPGAILAGKGKDDLFVVTTIEEGGQRLGQSFHTHYTLVGFNDSGSLGSGLPYRRTLAEVRRYWKRTEQQLGEAQQLVFVAILPTYHSGLMRTMDFQRAINDLLGLAAGPTFTPHRPL